MIKEALRYMRSRVGSACNNLAAGILSGSILLAPLFERVGEAYASPSEKSTVSVREEMRAGLESIAVREPIQESRTPIREDNEPRNTGNLRISESGKNFIRGYEEFREEAYLCPANKWTIGYGHTEGVKKGDKIDEPTARKIFEEDVKKFEEEVREDITVQLTQRQFDAFVSLAFNIGGEGFEDSSLVRDKNAGKDVYEIIKDLKKWNKITVKDENGKEKKVVCGGLVNRREDEAKIYLGERVQNYCVEEKR